MGVPLTSYPTVLFSVDGTSLVVRLLVIATLGFVWVNAPNVITARDIDTEWIECSGKYDKSEGAT